MDKDRRTILQIDEDDSTLYISVNGDNIDILNGVADVLSNMAKQNTNLTLDGILDIIRIKVKPDGDIGR